MPEAIDWLPDGTPLSPRFGDRYRGAGDGVAQAQQVFVAGCGLPQAWAQQRQWRILETGFGMGLNFLVTWAAWRADPARPQLLHFISCEAWPVAADDLLRAAPHTPELHELAQQLHAQFWGLLPGVHRLAFEGGRVLLTLYVGDAQAMLRQQQPVADAVYLDGFDPARNPDMWSAHLLKAVARCCRRGARLATWSVARSVREGLAQCGFVVDKLPGLAPKRHRLQACFDPRWEPRAGTPVLPDVALAAAAAPARCLVVGGGLAGAAVAASLARRGWQVVVLDAAPAPAAGASGLPAGLFASHVSPDDSLLSRLSRAGVRLTLQTLATLLPDARGRDWDDGGVLEHGVDAPIRLAWGSSAGRGTRHLSALNPQHNLASAAAPTPEYSPASTAASAQEHSPGLDWSRPASAAELRASHLSGDASACWHARGGWVRPPRLVQRLLEQPGITWQGNADVARLERGDSGLWRALDAQGKLLAEAELAVVCAGPASGAVADAPVPLQALRGQIAWGLHAEIPLPAPWPPQPVNGHGNLVPCAPIGPAGAPGWVLGSTFERDCNELPPSTEDIAAGRAENAARLMQLLPALGHSLAEHLRPHPSPLPRAGEGAATPPGAALLPPLPRGGEGWGEGAMASSSTAAPPPSTHTWAAVRCAAPDRLPLVGPLDAAARPGLWLSTAMGARGLTLALLCGELLAARLHGEPLPLDARLARALSSERLGRA